LISTSANEAQAGAKVAPCDLMEFARVEGNTASVLISEKRMLPGGDEAPSGGDVL
jgi:hypothetical protein